MIDGVGAWLMTELGVVALPAELHCTLWLVPRQNAVYYLLMVFHRHVTHHLD